MSAPPDFALDTPAAVRRTGPLRADVVVVFVTSYADLARRVPRLGEAVFPEGSLWVAWPKRSSGVATDVTEDSVREVALPLGLVDNKVCAISEVWSGLRLVWRKERRKLTWDRAKPWTAPATAVRLRREGERWRFEIDHVTGDEAFGYLAEAADDPRAALLAKVEETTGLAYDAAWTAGPDGSWCAVLTPRS